MTNFERIRIMTTEEMATLLESEACQCCAYYNLAPCSFKSCKEGIKKWLEQEVEN
ncbi:hypothetical protein [Cloacibacillus sp. An23]|uniref:hypothetical protein n=1 Tax=Cloacibacillus sp. An23 TaxID=1965591 RepID=UPI001302661D|nr:hypothetical protein [Cloacibacillus sp. An23]